METKVIVPNFAVDHTALQAGLYLRETRKLNPFTKVLVWDLRFATPSLKEFLSQGALNTIERIMNFKLRYILGSKFISFFPYGDTTGFGFISTSSLSEKELREALLDVIEHTVPILNPEEIPALSEKECGRPTMFNMNNANYWLNKYKAVLIK